MADLTITAASVASTATTVTQTGTAGAAITAGQALYRNATTGRLALAQADGTLAEATFVGIALNSAPAAGQPVTYALPTPGTSITLGTGTAGAVYVVSATAGGIAPTADISTTGNYRTVIGVGGASSTLYFCGTNTPQALP